MGNGSIQSWNCFKQFTEKRKNYNGDKLLVFVVKKKIPALLIKGLPAGSLFNGRQVTLSRGAKNHIYLKNVLVVAFLPPIFDTNSTYVLKWAF